MPSQVGENADLVCGVCLSTALQLQCAVEGADTRSVILAATGYMLTPWALMKLPTTCSVGLPDAEMSGNR